MGRKKVNKNINCLVCDKIFDGGRHYLVKKTCSEECLYKYRHSDEFIDNKKDGMKKTFQEKYGVNSYTETEEFRQKILKTFSEFSKEKRDSIKQKQSDSHLNRSKEDRKNIVNKIKKTKKENHGDENYNNSIQSLETILKNNNGIHHLAFKENKLKGKSKMLELYGVEHASQSDVIKEKQRKIINEKYGTNFYFSSEDFMNKITKNNKIKLIKVLDKNNLFIDLNNYIKNGYREKGKRIANIFNVKCNTCGTKFQTRISADFYKLDGKICRTCYPVINFSQLQVKVESFLQSLNIDYIKGDRTLIRPQEIDFYIPVHNLGIEVNGNYWHSETGGRKDIKYHLNKTQLANKQSVKLIHIFEDEIENRFEIVKSNIKNLLKIYDEVIDGNTCEIKIISNKIKNEFLENNHIEGICVDKYRYGLFNNNELVSVMCFGKLRNSKKNINKEGYELMRFCNRLNTEVTNSFSILLNCFIKTGITKYIKAIADVRWYGLKPTETILNKNGFIFDNLSRPNYKYLTNNYHLRVDKFIYSKKNILEMFGGDKNKSEFELAKENKIDKIWDCGNLVFEYKIL